MVFPEYRIYFYRGAFPLGRVCASGRRDRKEKTRRPPTGRPRKGNTSTRVDEDTRVMRAAGGGPVPVWRLLVFGDEDFVVLLFVCGYFGDEVTDSVHESVSLDDECSCSAVDVCPNL